MNTWDTPSAASPPRNPLLEAHRFLRRGPVNAEGWSQLALTICCLTVAVALGLASGAVFKLVPQWFPDEVGAVTGVVGAAGGLGGFFPPLVMALVKSLTGSYALGFILLAAVGVACLLVLAGSDPTASQIDAEHPALGVRARGRQPVACPTRPARDGCSG